MADQNLAQLMQLPGTGSPASPIPPANPIAQTQSSPFDLASIAQQVMNLPAYQQASSQLGALQGQEQKVSQAQAALKPPSMIYQPNYAPMTGQGFGGNVKGVIGNVGRGILEGLSAVTPRYGAMKSREFEMQRQKMADQISGLKAQEEIPTEELRGLTGLTQAGGLAAYRGGELADRQARTAAYTQKIQNSLSLGLRGLDLKAIALGNQTELAKARTALMQMQTELGPEKLELERYGIDTNNATRMSVANVMSALGIDKTHPVAQMLDQMFGTSMTPGAPQAPGGAAPVQGAPPQPQQAKPTQQRQKANTKTPGRMKYNQATGRLE